MNIPYQGSFMRPRGLKDKVTGSSWAWVNLPDVNLRPYNWYSDWKDNYMFVSERRSMYSPDVKIMKKYSRDF